MFSFLMRKFRSTAQALSLLALITACSQAPSSADSPGSDEPVVMSPGPDAGDVAPAPAPSHASPAPAPPPSPPPPAAAPAAALPPVGVPMNPVATCASAKMVAFPWPNPPQPSVFTQISVAQLFPAGTGQKSLLDLDRVLSGAISAAGYHQSTRLGVGCNGFAIILDLEHIEADGTRMSGADGFAPPSQQPEFSLTSFLVRLFHAPPGYYRQIVIVVSDQAIGAPTAAPSEGVLRRLAEAGTPALPPAFAQIPLSWQYKVIAAVYEFRKGPADGDARFIAPSGRLGALVHLMKARLL